MICTWSEATLSVIFYVSVVFKGDSSEPSILNLKLKHKIMYFTRQKKKNIKIDHNVNAGMRWVDVYGGYVVVCGGPQ